MESHYQTQFRIIYNTIFWKGWGSCLSAGGIESAYLKPCQQGMRRFVIWWNKLTTWNSKSFFIRIEWIIKTKRNRHWLSIACPPPQVGWGCRIHRLLLCRGVKPCNKCPGYDTKQSNGDVPVMLELWGMRSISSLPSLPGPLQSGVVAPDKVLSMGQIELNCVLMLNWIVWNRTVYMYKNGNGINLQWLIWLEKGWYAVK